MLRGNCQIDDSAYSIYNVGFADDVSLRIWGKVISFHVNNFGHLLFGKSHFSVFLFILVIFLKSHYIRSVS